MISLPQRALVLRIGALGDVLLTRRLTYSLSLAGFRSTLVAPARHATLLLKDPWIEGVLDGESPSLADAFAGAWPENHRGFDAAIVISNSPELALSAQCASPLVIRMPPYPVQDNVSIAQQWADAARDLGAPFALGLPSLPTDTTLASVVGATLIHPGSGSPHKNWPVERFVEVASALQDEGHHVVWVRGPAEAPFPPLPSSFSLLDCPALAALSATLAQSRLFIGNDSGVSHLAAAVGAPSLVIYGATSDRVWRPDGARIRTIRSATGELTAVPVEGVLALSRELARLGATLA